MQITIELPEDIAVGVESKWEDCPVRRSKA